MIGSIVRKIFGSRNERLLKQFRKVVDLVNALEPEVNILSNEELKNKTEVFKQRFKDGETLDALLPEAFAVVREVAKRTLGMRHFDVQLIGGMVLHQGKIAEMSTGEGKTLVATLPAYLNALSGNSVHIITVNDYLAARDAEWMQPIYSALGLKVGVVISDMQKADKQQAYQADIVYGTNNEFGFDYLRDNMAFEAKDRMQRGLVYAIIDEVDSILIDEARTPLIISGADQDSSEMYKKINTLIPQLVQQQEQDGEGDFYIDEKSKQAYLTEDGHQKIEKLLIAEGLLEPGASLYDAEHIGLMHHINAGLRAHFIFKNNVDYIVKNNEVVIVDEHTGRTMPGRRWSDGLHQAIEAKEGVPIQSENQTLASITFQNYFRLYTKLAGMTGTADTEAYELQQIYNLEVIVIPTNKQNRRQDEPDLIYLTQEDKFVAIVEDIKDCVQRKQPVLVGTISIETSEFLSKLLTKSKISHQVLNAKFHDKEAEIIAEAGRPGSVTIATNMAGRGTDIVLGGNLASEVAKIPDDQNSAQYATTENKLTNEWQARHDQVIQAGGLRIIGTERHESRRIDNQLRGRSGRQGDPGSTRFYLSIKDNLMRIFISDSLSGLLNKLGMDKGEAIEHSLVSRSVENAQRKVEGHNFDIRKQLLDFDDVANDQRKVIYQQRNEIMESGDIAETIQDLLQDVITDLVNNFIPKDSLEEQWQVADLEKCLEQDFGQKLAIVQWLDQDPSLHAETLQKKILEHFQALHAAKEQQIGADSLRYLEKVILLNVLDSHWKEHLATMDYMRQSIHLRGYAQKDPKQEYKREAFMLFTAMLDSIKREAIVMLSVMKVRSGTDIQAVDEKMRGEPQHLSYQHAAVDAVTSNNASVKEHAEQHSPYTRQAPKVGRNEPCPCGSGRKYKLCHGKLTHVDKS